MEEKKKNNNEVYSGTGPGTIKIFASISKELDKRIRRARHLLESDRMNSALVDILQVGVEQIENDKELVEKLKKKYTED